MKLSNGFYVLMNEAGGGDGGAGGGASGSASGGASSGTTPPGSNSGSGTSGTDWTATLSDEMKGYVSNKGFKDPSAVLDSYKNLEKLMGAPKDRLLTLPEKAEDKAAWDAIYNRLGRPMDPKEYNFKLDASAAVPEFDGFIRSAFHELGITKAQGEALMGKYGDFFKAQIEKVNGESQVNLDNQVKALKKEWGAALEQNTQIAKNAVNAFGLDAAKIDALEAALGYDGVMKFFHDIGSKIGNHTFVEGQGSGARKFTPEGAKTEIARLRADSDFVRRYTSGDRSAKAELETLHKYAYPGEESY